MSINLTDLRALLVSLVGAQPLNLSGLDATALALPKNGNIEFFSVPDNLRYAPRATTGLTEFHEYAGFVEYVNEYKGDNSASPPDSLSGVPATSPRLFVNPSLEFAAGGIIARAYLDYPAKGRPRWSTHQATLVVKPSLEYSLLMALDGKLFQQDEFARKIRDVARYCTSLQAADLLELAQTLVLANKGDFKSLANDLSGAVTLLYDVQVSASAGTSQKKINVPEKIDFEAPLLLGSTNALTLTADLFYRVPSQPGEKITMGLRFPDRKFAEREALLAVVSSLSKDTSLPTSIGTTSVPSSFE